MVKLLLIVLYFKIVNLQLIVPKEKDDLRQCIHSLIGNISIGYSTVLFYSDNSYDYGFYNSIEISFINIDARRNIYNFESYRMGKEVIVISVSKTEQVRKFLMKMHSVGLWSYRSTQIRRFIIILPFKEQRRLEETLFPYLWKIHMVNVVCLYYDENKIKLYTSDPEHPANECGDIAQFIYQYGCNRIEKIKFPNPWRNYKDCTLIYWNRAPRAEHFSVIFFRVFFVLETARQHLNFTIVINTATNITEQQRFLIYVSHVSVCGSTSHECSMPFVSNGLIWIVPAPNIIDALEVFKITFKQIVWILILVSFLFISIVWWYVSKCKHHRSFVASVLDIYSATLLGYINRIPPFLSLRLIFVTYLFYATHIQTAFTSHLIRLLTVPQYDHSITSLDELSQSQLPILTHGTMDFVFKHEQKDDSIYNKLKNKIVMVNESYLFGSILNKEILRNSSILISNVDLDIIIKMKECVIVTLWMETKKTLFQRNVNTAVTSPTAVVRKRPKMSSKENENPASQSTIEIS
ncbi:hypothetical protein FQA39_LY15654 [Lamprigera yunnana]|nr:hypothetical protein FQA39_LY15654 [Lamprigera yunnana]